MVYQSLFLWVCIPIGIFGLKKDVKQWGIIALGLSTILLDQFI